MRFLNGNETLVCETISDLATHFGEKVTVRDLCEKPLVPGKKVHADPSQLSEILSGVLGTLGVIFGVVAGVLCWLLKRKTQAYNRMTNEEDENHPDPQNSVQNSLENPSYEDRPTTVASSSITTEPTGGAGESASLFSISSTESSNRPVNRNHDFPNDDVHVNSNIRDAQHFDGSDQDDWFNVFSRDLNKNSRSALSPDTSTEVQEMSLVPLNGQTQSPDLSPIV